MKTLKEFMTEGYSKYDIKKYRKEFEPQIKQMVEKLAELDQATDEYAAEILVGLIQDIYN